jgi:hypothetical protein
MVRSILFETARELTAEELLGVAGGDGPECTGCGCESTFEGACSDASCTDGCTAPDVIGGG